MSNSTRGVAPSARPIGNTALLAAGIITAIQLSTGSHASGGPYVVALMLCVVGTGLRIESAVRDRASETNPATETRQDHTSG
ncbi:hypothetical protein SAMN04487820_102183 [Actinopolyspora mzabensis]|uniref:Uncharacterized protein n=1 Tax=Actinopolyspora mzabensis TaxID=995066 RepID=A0A1G8WQN9_ACTMZ|nr:hypothetical protein [Actinopolyspora mzabensis]SDJ80692.1 hypothetical protein SAMN04487820_102183 [Actinopolyspora mzabensis]